MVGILCCKKSHWDSFEIEKILKNNGIEAECVNIESAEITSFAEYSLLINASGSYFAEDKVHLLTEFSNSGRVIIHMSAAPLTRVLPNGEFNARMLRSIGIIDDFRPISQSSSYVKAISGDSYAVSLTGMQSAVYHLSRRDETGTYYDAHLEHIVDAFDENHSLLASPVIRVVSYGKGSMTFFNFDFTAELLSQDFWTKQFLHVVHKELTGNVLLTVDCDYARYCPGENQNISINISSINLNTQSNLELRTVVFDSKEKIVYESKEEVITSSLPYETHVSLNEYQSDLYRVLVTVSTQNPLSGDTSLVIATKETGFLVISEEELLEKVSDFSPMYIDESVSTDFCLIDGQTTAILGTTYFVTDEYRKCFYNMNAWLCAKEMAELRDMGFNVLRSGNWKHMENFYNADGSISKRGLRALQVYFLFAAENGFTVQFALGNVMLNQWDESLSPIHNTDMRRKCMTYVNSFAENFKDYANVCLDIVNEPSYSHKGAWTPARPSGDPEELEAYRQWLSRKYKGNISTLRDAWAESSAVIKNFDDIQMPTDNLFSRWYNRTDHRINCVPVADFYQFAREEFLGWTAEVRKTAKEAAPNMVITMGRDETLRIPAQQDEILAGNIDMVCWHQWHKNATIITEYLLNRVRGKLCVAQELGMYKYDDVRGGKRYSDDEMITKLGKKLLYSFGNFVQWQSHDDPYMFELSENSLGLFRADMSPSPSVEATKRLIDAEKSMQSYMRGIKEDTTKILSVYGTSHYFSVEHAISQQGIRTHIQALYNHLGEQADFLPEHLFTKENAEAIGTPKLIILPGMQMLNKNTWNLILDYVKNGATLLVSGCIDKDEFFRDDTKIGALDKNYSTRKLLNFEEITVEGIKYTADFQQIVDYTDVSNALNCGQVGGADNLLGMYNGSHSLSEYAVGKGTILYCPYPLEFSTNMDATCALYRYAIKRAKAESEIYRILEKTPNIVFTGTPYQECTVYTLINEGFGTTVSWLDLQSGKEFTRTVKADGGCKLWVSTNGEIMRSYEI